MILEVAFLRSTSRTTIVAELLDDDADASTRLAAPWSSQQGSLLLWVSLLSLWSSLVLFLTRRRVREIAPYATAMLLGFGGVLHRAWRCSSRTRSSTTLANPPAEGAGLDPLLLHPSMMIHPPMLYSGYTLLTIPFAFALGALITGRLNAEWIRVTRRFALAAWLFLGIGILLGARWSYTELGWGGYWALGRGRERGADAVASRTAFIHSIMIQEKRGMLKVWNVSLVLGERHARDPRHVPGALRHARLDPRVRRLDARHPVRAAHRGHGRSARSASSSTAATVLRSEHQLDSLLSREAMFLFQNLVLVAMVFVIFWITFFPLISEAVTGIDGRRSGRPPSGRSSCRSR